MNVIEFSGDEAYQVSIGSGILANLVDFISGYNNIAIFIAEPVFPIAQKIQSSVDNSVKVSIKIMPDGELAKSITNADECWSFLADCKITRNDLIIGVGGGAVTDLVNFVAATWLRGTDVVLVPTTVLAMVDAAIGGKSAINTSYGKNLVGVFNDPVAVYCDTDFLSTLDPADLRAGFAEVVKCGFISDPEILQIVQQNPIDVLNYRSSEFLEVLNRAIKVKAQVVAADPFEQSKVGVGRAALNYGHTLGHAIEKQSNFRWRHGDAISVGMIFAAELAYRLEMISQELLSRHYEILEAIKLPTRYQAASLSDLIPIMSLDKKALGPSMRFVLLNGLAQPQFVTDPSPDTLASAFRELERG